jgi:EAL domain-containing protein (putative c-di-GMP-specific phosphodiesterase class I)
MELEMDLREALANEEFLIAYQPTFALSNMSPTGVEALIRWQHPKRGLMQPEEFVPLLEETGLINGIGSWVLRQACAQAASWRAAGYTIGLAVNVSARQLDRDQLIADVEEALCESGLDPGALTIEITETALMRDVEEIARRLAAVKQLGVRIAIDDFGTGYSSLSSLKRLPVDIVKVDRSFISGVLNDPHDETIADTIISIAARFGFESLAEGVEDLAEIGWLRQRPCRYMQGYAICHPLPIDAFKAWLDGHEG